jgi:hypothetical protein
VLPKLQKAFGRIERARLQREIEPDAGGGDDGDGLRSYYLFFISPRGAAFEYETEIEDEDGAVKGDGTIGWSAAASLLAPFAVVTMSEMEAFEDGSVTEPSIESGLSEGGQPYEAEASYRRQTGEQAYGTLLQVRDQIGAILEKHWISVLPQAEWSKPVPWMKAGDDVVVGDCVRVLDALFFELL